MKLRTMLQNVPDPRGKQGQDYFLWSILGLIVVSLLCGRRGMLAAFHLGRSLNKRQRLALGFTKGVTPCHATLTETLRCSRLSTIYTPGVAQAAFSAAYRSAQAFTLPSSVTLLPATVTRMLLASI